MSNSGWQSRISCLCFAGTVAVKALLPIPEAPLVLLPRAPLGLWTQNWNWGIQTLSPYHQVLDLRIFLVFYWTKPKTCLVDFFFSLNNRDRYQISQSTQCSGEKIFSYMDEGKSPNDAPPCPHPSPLQWDLQGAVTLGTIGCGASLSHQAQKNLLQGLKQCFKVWGPFSMINSPLY